MATLVIAGIPAALFERFTGRRESDTVSLGVWLGTSAVIAALTLLNQSNG